MRSATVHKPAGAARPTVSDIVSQACKAQARLGWLVEEGVYLNHLDLVDTKRWGETNTFFIRISYNCTSFFIVTKTALAVVFILRHKYRRTVEK